MAAGASSNRTGSPFNKRGNQMRVGFAGLGRMGNHMARNLVAAGHDVAVWTRNPKTLTQFCQDTGTAAAGSPTDLASRAEVVVTMLADDSASQAVYLGVDGLFSTPGGAQIFLEMSTISPAHLAHLQTQAGTRLLIDAPVSGATQAAKDAMLMIMAGANEAQIAPIAPLFNAMGKQTIALGRQGAGSVMKLAINAVIHGLNQSASEALNLAVAAGIDLPLAYDALEASAACAPMLSYRRDQYLDEANQEVSFTVALAEKDMRLVTELAEKLGVQAPQAALTRDTLQNASHAGFDAHDMASIIHYLREETP